jgi:FkbM family methyltransferase
MNRQIILNDFDGDLKFQLDLGGHMGSQIFWYGSYSRHVLRVLDLVLRPGMTVLDVGANAGEISVFAAKRVGETGKVFSFEPLTIMADRLRTNIAMNNMTQVKVVQMGLSDVEGEAPIYSAGNRFHDGTHNEGLSTIYPGADRTKELETIRLTRADTLFADGQFDTVHVIKIDVEGAELAVLHGARDVIEAHHPWLILEVSQLNLGQDTYEASAILDHLSEFEYRFYTIDRRHPLRPLTVEKLAPFQNVLACPPGKTLPVA